MLSGSEPRRVRNREMGLPSRNSSVTPLEKMLQLEEE